MRDHRRSSGPAHTQLRTWNRPTYIRSIQRGTIVLNNVTSNTATVTAVDPAQAVLSYLGVDGGLGNQVLTNTACKVVLTNSTTITASVNTAVATNHTVGYELVEFWPGILKSVQLVTITLVGVGSNTATITAVNPGKATLYPNGFTVTDATFVDTTIYGAFSLTNATTVTYARNGATGTVTALCTVVEYF